MSAVTKVLAFETLGDSVLWSDDVGYGSLSPCFDQNVFSLFHCFSIRRHVQERRFQIHIRNQQQLPARPAESQMHAEGTRPCACMLGLRELELETARHV